MIQSHAFANKPYQHYAPLHIVEDFLDIKDHKPFLSSGFTIDNAVKNGIPPIPGEPVYTKEDVVYRLLTQNLLNITRFEQATTRKYSFPTQSSFYNAKMDRTTIRRIMQRYFVEKAVPRTHRGKRYKLFPLKTTKKAILSQVERSDILPKWGKLYADFDTVCTDTNTKGAGFHYLHQRGYQPVVASAERIPLGLEGRPGNTFAGVLLQDITYNVVEFLRRVRPATFAGVRIDGAACNEEIINYLHNKLKVRFYIRLTFANKKASNATYNDHIIEGRRVVFGQKRIDVGGRWYRMVFYKAEKGETIAVITNDWETESELEVSQIFKNHGVCEQVNRDLKQFGWTTMPFRTIELNMAYMGLCMFNFVTFKWITHRYHNFVSGFDPDLINPHIQPRTFQNEILNCDGHLNKQGKLVLNEPDIRRKYMYERILKAQRRLRRIKEILNN